MNKLKDFFYKHNDIIVVLLILAVAVFLIHSRVNIIMDYPDSALTGDQTQQTQEVQTEEQ